MSDDEEWNIVKVNKKEVILSIIKTNSIEEAEDADFKVANKSLSHHPSEEEDIGENSSIESKPNTQLRRSSRNNGSNQKKFKKQFVNSLIP